jgi:hypothetical protein
MEKSFLQKCEEQIQETIASGKFSINEVDVEDDEEVVGEMTDREKAMYTLSNRVSEDSRKICEQCLECDVSSFSDDCPKENGLMETARFWTICMWMEIMDRLRIWDKPLKLRKDFRIVSNPEKKIRITFHHFMG